jgi:hypothetical protein
MNNLHRELAPISHAAWSQIEDEVARTFKRSVAGRRVVDVKGPGGTELSGVGTGHQIAIAAPQQGVVAKLSEVKSLVELTVPFELQREAIDSVLRGAKDADWQPAKEAAKELAYAEDRAISTAIRPRVSAACAKARRTRRSRCRPTLPLIRTRLATRSKNCGLPVSTAPIRCCLAPTPTRHSPRRAIRVIRSSNTSSGL